MNKLIILTRAGALVCVIAGLILLVGPWLSGCSCGAAGCPIGATMSIDLAEGMSIPDGSTATACLNDTCVVGGLPASTTIEPDRGRYVTFPQGAGVSGVVWSPAPQQGTRVEIQWLSLQDRQRFQTGDRFSVTLKDAAGATIAMKQATASSYVTQEPNGSYCGPTCYVAQFPQ